MSKSLAMWMDERPQHKDHPNPAMLSSLEKLQRESKPEEDKRPADFFPFFSSLSLVSSSYSEVFQRGQERNVHNIPLFVVTKFGG